MIEFKKMLILFALIIVITSGCKWTERVARIPPGEELEKTKILDDLIIHDKKVSLPSELFSWEGASHLLPIGIRNKQNSTLNYSIEFKAHQGPNGSVFSIDNPAWFEYRVFSSLEVGDSEVRSIRLKVPKNLSMGRYSLSLNIVNDDALTRDIGDIYETMNFSIVIKER